MVFKAGDKVKCIDADGAIGLYLGNEYTVDRDANAFAVQLRETGTYGWFPERFILVTDSYTTNTTFVPQPGATSATPKFDTSVQNTSSYSIPGPLGFISSNVGVKHDSDKLQFRLIDPGFYRDMAGVLTLGARKYAPMNWLKVDRERYVDALERHWNAYRNGEADDPESKLGHLVHVAVNAMFIWAHDRRKA
jgi:hypothetical protein